MVLALAISAYLLGGGLPGDARLVLSVFTAAIGLWAFTDVDDTFVAVAAAATLVLAGVQPDDALFATLGDETIWLLVAAFVLGTGVAASGLVTRVAVRLVIAARSIRQLAHRVTAALVLTSFMIPATSGRAALALPVFCALAAALDGRPRVVRALAVLFPTVILLSAVATLIGAGAHLITDQILAATTGERIGFGHWLLLGTPLALLSSHLATEVVLVLFTRGSDRREQWRLSLRQLASRLPTPVIGPLRPTERRAASVLAIAVLLWCSEPLHGLSPALVALLAALAVTAPGFGTVALPEAVKKIPWSLLLFMAATAALATALVSSGAAATLASGLFPAEAPPWLVLLLVITASAASHLLIQSRSARSSVLVPLVIPAAIAVGINPAAAAFASTAAAGFCQTLPSSAKPVAIFADVDGVPTYGRRDLLRLAAVLGPLLVALVGLFALVVWPLLGMPLLMETP